MMTDQTAAATSILAAVILGLSGSLHCYLMCGALACAGQPAGGAPSGRRAWVAGAFLAARIAGYGALGGALGLLGGGVSRALSASARPLLPWVMAVALVVPALGLGRWLKGLPLFAGPAQALARRALGLPPSTRAVALGALTPLLPCGWLWGVFPAVMATGSAVEGMLLLSAFGLGGTPALIVAQLQVGFLQRLPRVPALVVQRALPLIAAAVLVYRGLTVGPAGCCH